MIFDLKKPRISIIQTSEIKKLESLKLKMERITVPLRLDQLEGLSHLEREIMGNRSRGFKKQRVTKNSIIRVCIDIGLALKIDVREIPDEEELGKRFKEALSGKEGGDK